MPWNTITGLFAEHGALLSRLGGLSLLMFVGSLIAVPMVIVRLPDRLNRAYPTNLLLMSYVAAIAVGMLALI